MPSPTAGLFGGLATGIFGRMREHEDEQRQMDLEERKNALTSLSSLLEHATPDTRPVIYKQMADVMKLKGKHRGVWDMLTGQGRDDYHQQLSSQLDNVFGNVVGPEKYQQLQQEGVRQDLGAAFQANSPYVRSTEPKPTEGKIALRDPIAEHLNALKSQYGLQNDRRSAEIELRNKLAGERELANDIRDAASQKDIAEQRAALKAFGPIMQRAQALSGGMAPTREAIEQAAQEHAAKFGLDIDKLKAQIEFLSSGARRNDAMAQSLGEGGAGRPQTENQKLTFDASQRKEAATTYEKWNKAKANITRLDTEHQAVRQQLNQLAQSQGVSYDEANGRFYDKNGQTVDPDLLGIPRKQLDSLMSKMAKLAADKAAAANELQGHRSTLEGQFPSLYTFGDQWSVTPNPEVGGLAPAGAPRTGNPPEWKMPLNGPNKVGEIKQYKSTSPIPVGTVIDAGPKGKFKVAGIAGKDKDGTIIHNIVPVKE